MTKENLSEEARIALRGYYKGFEVVIEKKNSEGRIDFEGITRAVDHMIGTGFTPLPEPAIEAQKELPENEFNMGSEEAIPVCPTHNVQLIQREGKYGQFWACPTKNPDGSWCKRRPKADKTK